MLLTRWEPKSWWISAMCPDSHTRWTTAPSRFACVHVFFFFSFFALLPVSHSATLLYNSLVLTPAISLLFIPSHSSHSKEYKEDAARPSASCVPFLLVTQTKKKRRKKKPSQTQTLVAVFETLPIESQLQNDNNMLCALTSPAAAISIKWKWMQNVVQMLLIVKIGFRIEVVWPQK